MLIICNNSDTWYVVQFKLKMPLIIISSYMLGVVFLLVVKALIPLELFPRNDKFSSIVSYLKYLLYFKEDTLRNTKFCLKKVRMPFKIARLRPTFDSS